jgi:type IV pilus assembly protein PilW
MRLVRFKTHRTQYGVSVIEVLVATAIASSVTILGSALLLQTQKHSFELIKRIELIQTLYQSLFMLKAELRRAGYNPGLNASLTLTGATKVVETGDDWLDFMTISPQGDWYKTRYQRDPLTNTIDLCVQRVSVHLIKPVLGQCSGNFYSILDENQLRLTEFSVVQSAIAGQRSSLVNVQLELSSQYSGEILSQWMIVKQRNWQ